MSKLEIPKNEFIVELDEQRRGLIILDGNTYYLDGEVADLVRNMLEEIDTLRILNTALQDSAGQTGVA
jgi:isochorismate hydrolase|tara:strand:+ start:1763 stop:1966 length:204 start_codon:yes stop_codon:yes gene_type:complete